MKIGVSSYSFRKLINSGQMSQLEMIDKAEEMGFDVLEFSGFNVPEGETILSFAKKLKDKCDSVGIEMGNYTISADFLKGSDGNLDAEIERVKKEVDVAAALGAKGMRHDASSGFPGDYIGARGFNDALPFLIKGCRTVTEYAADLNIRTMVENHGFFCQDSDRVELLVNGVNHPNFGVLLDIGNFLCVDEDPGQAVGRLKSYIFHVHGKDFHVKDGVESDPGQGWFQTRGGNYLRGSIIGHGSVEVIKCLRIIKKSGYNGTVSIEFEGMEDPLLGISVGLENLKRYIEQV